MVMKTTGAILFITLGLSAGCAHQGLVTDGSAGERDARGSAHVGHQARAIVAGPARMVHASGEKPVRWFVVDRVSGGDSDCLAPGAAGAPLSESTGVHTTIAPGHVLCAAVAQGATDVTWHRFGESPAMWALRRAR
jgi:hypothetical protein